MFVCFCVCTCVGGWLVMLPWRVPCSPEKGFFKKRGMPARCTSVGVMLGVGVGVCVRFCERVRKSCRRTRERERERERFALPKVHPVLLLRLARPRPSPAPPPPCSGTLPDILGPPFSPPRPILSHPMVSPLFSPTYLYPPYPHDRPVSAGQPSVASAPSTRLLTASTSRSIFSASSYFSWSERDAARLPAVVNVSG